MIIVYSEIAENREPNHHQIIEATTTKSTMFLFHQSWHIQVVCTVQVCFVDFVFRRATLPAVGYYKCTHNSDNDRWRPLRNRRLTLLHSTCRTLYSTVPVDGSAGTRHVLPSLYIAPMVVNVRPISASCRKLPYSAVQHLRTFGYHPLHEYPNVTSSWDPKGPHPGGVSTVKLTVH